MLARRSGRPTGRLAERAAWQPVAKGIRGRWWNAGHILGSASVELEVETGNPESPRFGILFLHEPVTWRYALGVILTIAGVTLIVLR